MSHAAMSHDMILERDNVVLSEGSGRSISFGLIGLGGLMLLLTVLGGLTGDVAAGRIAIHSIHMGAVIVLGISLAAMLIVMIFHQTNAGWATTVRRQFENMMSCVWVGTLLIAGVIILNLFAFMPRGVFLWEWMDAEHVAGDVLYQAKKAYLNDTFFYVRAVVYFAVWLLLAAALYGMSTRQDEEGDKWITARARKLSAVGIPLVGFTSAFAAFDWIMGLDYHFYSTMFGVFYFAQNMVAALTLGTLILLVLRFFGRLHGAFTAEHLHDLGKLIFGFTVFWAYISFSQYFLIWYANLPEETAYFVKRKEGHWEIVSWIIPIGHFIAPFIWLIPRPARRNGLVVGIACVWLLLMHIVDVFWYIGPEAELPHGDAPSHAALVDWRHVTGVLGPICIFLGVLMRRIARSPLIPLRDPRLHEALHHENYV